MKSHLSATQAVRQFSDVLNRVRYRGEEFVIDRGGEPVCQIVPARPAATRTVAELVQALRALPKPDAEYLDTLEALTKNQQPLPPSPWPR